MFFKKKVVAIVQARMGSERLPGKVLIPIEGKPALQWCVEQIKKAKTVDEICVATTVNRKDYDIVCFSKNILKVYSYTGSEEDVLSRVTKAAEKMQADYIVEITADCPLIDPKDIDFIVKKVKKFKSYYGSNVHPRKYPDGFDIQVYPIESLKLANSIVTDKTHRHHVGWNIFNYQKTIINFIGKKISSLEISVFPIMGDYSDLECTLDTQKDLDILSQIYQYLKRINKIKNFTVWDVIAWLIKHPQEKQQRKVPGEG
jgi:spore coat polysaccharide biosynthesis protein SpsF